MSEDKYRTGLKRFGAAFLDWFVFWGPLALYLRYRIFKAGMSFSDELWKEATCITAVWLFLRVCYSVFCHYRFGHTIGKWVANVQVLDVSETRKLSFSQAVLRDAVPVAVGLGGLVYFAVALLFTDDPYNAYNNYYDLTSGWVTLWTVLEIITMLFNSKRRGLHDLIARSVVVRLPEDKSRLSRAVYHS